MQIGRCCEESSDRPLRPLSAACSSVQQRRGHRAGGLHFRRPCPRAVRRWLFGYSGLAWRAGRAGYLNAFPSATGAAGAIGPQGPSGAVTVLDFDASWGPTMLPGNNGNTIISPMACRTTPPYVPQTAKEVAVVTFHGTASPSAAVNDVLYIDVMVSQNGGAFNAVTVGYSAESMQDGTANASVSKRIPLTQGTSYVFGTGFSSKAAVSVNAGYCQGVVSIQKF